MMKSQVFVVDVVVAFALLLHYPIVSLSLYRIPKYIVLNQLILLYYLESCENKNSPLSGDTVSMLKNADTVLNVIATKRLIAAYADIYADQKTPYASPVYGNFSKGFPPTLIQVGTKEILLSDSVRLYQALDQAGIPSCFGVKA